MKKLTAIILCVSIICTVFIACSKQAENETTTGKNVKDTTIATTNSSDTATDFEDDDNSISVNEALNYLEEFYGKPFTVNATINEDGIQNFKIIDKNGNLYARVSIDLKTSKMKETIEDTKEINEYTIK